MFLESLISMSIFKCWNFTERSLEVSEPMRKTWNNFGFVFLQTGTRRYAVCMLSRAAHMTTITAMNVQPVQWVDPLFTGECTTRSRICGRIWASSPGKASRSLRLISPHVWQSLSLWSIEPADRDLMRETSYPARSVQVPPMRHCTSPKVRSMSELLRTQLESAIWCE